jgi:hypothetical protein
VPGFNYWRDDRLGFGLLWPDDVDAPLPHKQNGTAYSRNGTSGHRGRKKKPTTDFAKYLSENGCNASERELLADLLGVDAEALAKLQIGWVPETKEEPEHWLFPERDGAGAIIGLLRRYPNGEKKRMAGSRGGLVFDPTAPISQAEVLLIVEGPTDVAAAMTMGLCAVGRPNNLGGWELLGPLIQQRAQTRGTLCVTLGENDQKEDGHWPGKDGAVHIASQLMRFLLRGMPWCMPPEGVKDLRDWLWRSSPNLNNEDECRKAGREVLKHIYANVKWFERPVEQVSTEQACQTVCHIRDSLYRNTNTENLVPTAQKSTPANFSEWDSLTPAIQDILARGRSAKWCPRHFVPLLQGRSNPSKGLSLQVSCRRWSCPECARRQRCRWLMHFMLIFELQTTLYGEHITAKQLHYRTQYIRAQRGDYLAITQADGRILLIANCEFPDGRVVTAMEAADLVAQALQNLDTAKRRPISTSKAWSLRDERKEADYVRRGAAPRGRFALVVHRLRRAQLDPDVRPTDRGARADWLFPGSWPAEQIEWFYEGLAMPPGIGEADGDEEARR